MKFREDRPYADPEAAARRLMEHARAFEPIQDGRIYIEKINYPFIDGDKASPEEYWAGLQFAIAREWLEYHPSGTYVRVRAARSTGGVAPAALANPSTISLMPMTSVSSNPTNDFAIL